MSEELAQVNKQIAEVESRLSQLRQSIAAVEAGDPKNHESLLTEAKILARQLEQGLEMGRKHRDWILRDPVTKKGKFNILADA